MLVQSLHPLRLLQAHDAQMSAQVVHVGCEDVLGLLQFLVRIRRRGLHRPQIDSQTTHFCQATLYVQTEGLMVWQHLQGLKIVCLTVALVALLL